MHSTQSKHTVYSKQSKDTVSGCLGLSFQFTVRGFSKCDAAFVHYSLFESYSLSGPKVSSGAHQYLSNVQKAGKTA